MAKRDKLYTVNKWNRPFFEEERRKKLYGGGGSTDNYVWGLNTDQGLTRAGIAQAPVDAGWKRNMPGWASDGEQASNPWREVITTHAAIPTENATPAGNLNQQDTNASNGSNNSKLRMIQDAAIAARDFASGIQSVNKLADLGKPISNPTQISSSPSTGLFGDTGFGARTTVFTETPYTPSTSTVFNNVLNPRNLSQNIISPKTVDYTLQGASGFSNTADNFQKTIGYYLQTNPQSDFAKSVVLNNVANSKITQPSLIEGYTPKVQTSGISDLGKAGVGIGASVLGEVGGNLISDGFSTVPGTLINQIGSTAGSVISMIPGVGWWVGPAITLGSKLLGGVYNRAFGSEYKDNGATAYTNQLNALNPNGSNEYLANLLASTGVGPRATSRNGWFNHSAERRADRTNIAQDLAFNRFQRGVRDAFGNNNWKQLQYALNDYTTYGAMGGRIKRKKCNCKATGGFLNNAMLDSASATGYNFLSDLTNMQMQNNQNKQNMGSSLGNSFTGLSNGTLFANGGGININPAHKGEFTAKAKRHGMGVQQFANYVLAHKDKFPTSTIRQAVFAKNSNTWKKAFGGKLNYGKDKDIRDSGFFDGQTLYAIGGPLQAMSSNWSPGGNVTEINAGSTHEENPYEGVQVGVDPEGTPNLVEENEVIWNDYVFSNRLKVPKEVCKELRVGQKKDGFTFAEVAKKLLKESKERPNDPISKRGLDANMQKLEDAQEELKQKMEAEEAVEQFNSLPPEQQVAIMQQEGEKAQDAVAQEQMAQEIQNLPPEQQQAIAQQMAMEQAQQQGVPQQGMSPEEQYAMQQQAAQDQYAAQRDARNQEVLAQAAAMQQAGLNGAAFGGKLFELGGNTDVNNLTGPIGRKAKAHWERDARGNKVLVPNSKYGWEGFGGGSFGSAGGGASWGEDPAPLMPRKRDWLAIDYKESFNKAYERARKEKKKTFWFNGKEYSTAYNPNLTKEEVEAGNNRYQTKGLLITPWEHAYGGLLFAEGGELGTNEGQLPEEQYQQNEQPVEQADNEMAKYSDEELQDMIEDYQEAESGEVKVTKGKLARLRKKAEKAQAELERRHAEENAEQPQEARQEPSQEELQAAAQEQAMQAQQPIEGQPQEGMPQEGMSPEQAMMMQQQMAGQMGQGSPEEMAAMEQQGQYCYGGRLYLTGGQFAKALGYSNTKDAKFIQDLLNITDWNAQINPDDPKLNEVYSKVKNPTIKHLLKQGWTPFNNGVVTNEDWYEDKAGDADNWMQAGRYKTSGYNQDDLTALAARYPYMQDVINSNFTDRDWEKQGNITPKEMQAAIDGSAMWRSTNQWLADPTYGQQRMVDYITRRRNLDKESVDTRFIDKWNQYGTFVDDGNGNYTYRLKDEDGIGDKFSQAFWKARGDGLLGTMFDVRVPANPVTRNFILDENGNPTDVESFDPEADGYVRVGNPYTFYTTGTNENNTFAPGVNNTISYWRKNDSQLAGNSSNNVADNNSNYLTVGWQPKTDWASYTLGAMPGLTGLGMMLGRGAPDMSGLDEAVAAYERNTGTMIAPHLTHGLIRPAIIDPRITRNSMNQSRLGTNRLLMNTGASPSRGATILANDANSINQLGQAMIENWKANRAQEQAAAGFNRETATTNANILNQVDQFNAQTQSALARDAAQLRYQTAKDKIAARDAYYQGLIGNLGSVMSGVNEAYKQNQRKNERDLLLASGVFGETNPFLENYYGISKVDPNTGQVVRGYNTGMYYWINPNTGKAEYLKTPPLATTPINACGGKIKKNKKRKGYTF